MIISSILKDDSFTKVINERGIENIFSLLKGFIIVKLISNDESETVDLALYCPLIQPESFEFYLFGFGLIIGYGKIHCNCKYNVCNNFKKLTI